MLPNVHCLKERLHAPLMSKWLPGVLDFTLTEEATLAQRRAELRRSAVKTRSAKREMASSLKTTHGVCVAENNIPRIDGGLA